MSLSSQMQALHTQSASMRADLWGITVTLSSDTITPKRAITCSGSPLQGTRQADELRSGYINRTIRTIMVLRSQLTVLGTPPTVALGTEFTITADAHNPANVGTVWRCFDLNDSSAGSEIKAVCFRLD